MKEKNVGMTQEEIKKINEDPNTWMWDGVTESPIDVSKEVEEDLVRLGINDAVEKIRRERDIEAFEESMYGFLLQRAIIFAAMKHEKQKRKGTDIPYIVHLMDCMYLLSFCGCGDNTIIAGLLHDTLEDTDTTPEEISKNFGDHILKLVQNESEDKSKSWRERKQATLDHLASVDNETQIVCFADKLSNIRSMCRDYGSVGDELWKRFNADKKSLKWYYSSLLEIFKGVDCEGVCDKNMFNLLLDQYETLFKSIFEY